MLYEMMLFTLMVLIFCFFTITFVVKVMISVLNSAKPEGMDEIKPIQIIKMPEKKPKKSEYERYLEEQKQKEQERYDTIMRNLEAYDGTEIGQEEVK